MFKILLFLLRFFLFWMLFFVVDKALFLLVFYQNIENIPLTEVLGTFYHAVPIDLSMTAYMSAAPLIFLVFMWFKGDKTVRLNWIKTYTLVLTVIFSILSIVNFNIYREWGTKLNAKAFGFAFSAPNEALASGASSPIVPSLVALVALITFGFFLIKRLIPLSMNLQYSPIVLKIVVSILLMGFNFLFIRGGVGVSTMNQSKAYFSDDAILNQAAVNTEWNLISSILASRKVNRNNYNVMPAEEATKIVSDLYAVQKDTTINILNTKRPNVILIIMESFTADLTKVLGQEDGITPQFDSLVNKGVLFSKIYSTGNRTDKGIVGTLAGYPSLAAGNMVNFPNKFQRIPAISQDFKKQGYSTSFFYGGESEFDNYKAFIISHDYTQLIDKNDFEKKDMNSKWGAYDGLVFNRQLAQLNHTRQPFFSTQMTLTNHEPFEVPGAYKFGNTTNITKFKSTAFYTDSCINSFLSQAKLQPWYKNTLFIFIADHGHIYPKERYDVAIPERYHIPLLFYGDVIKKEFRGKSFDNIGSQADLAATLLKQLKINTKHYPWSKDLLNPYTKPFAFFSWDNGMGFIDSKHCVTFDNVGKRILYNSQAKDKTKTAETLKKGQSYLQTIYQQFIEL
jgi:phosphoglycerol transferase MdoB-like AlkP superfamily enzyme